MQPTPHPDNPASGDPTVSTQTFVDQVTSRFVEAGYVLRERPEASIAETAKHIVIVTDFHGKMAGGPLVSTPKTVELLEHIPAELGKYALIMEGFVGNHETWRTNQERVDQMMLEPRDATQALPHPQNETLSRCFAFSNAIGVGMEPSVEQRAVAAHLKFLTKRYTDLASGLEQSATGRVKASFVAECERVEDSLQTLDNRLLLPSSTLYTEPKVWTAASISQLKTRRAEIVRFNLNIQVQDRNNSGAQITAETLEKHDINQGIFIVGSGHTIDGTTKLGSYIQSLQTLLSERGIGCTIIDPSTAVFDRGRSLFV